MMGGMGMGGPLAWIMPVIMVVIMAAMASGAFFARHRRHEVRRGDRPLDVLQHRYARGEIDREEYLERKVMLDDDDR